MLTALFYLVRDLAMLAAAVGISWWCWEQYRSRKTRMDETVRASLAAERQSTDLRQWMQIFDGRTEAIATAVAAMAATGREKEVIADAKVRVHRLLQSTTDPFLTFAELERGLANVGRLATSIATSEGTAPPAAGPLSGDLLRRVLIDLVSDGVVAQLDRDRYFIASDFEAGADEDDPKEA